MTIKKRLLISHLVMFVTPLVLLGFVLLTAFCGIFLFIRSGNHIVVESDAQFNHASEIIYYLVFHKKRSQQAVDRTSDYDYLIRTLDPEQNLIILRKGEETIFQYGNEELLPLEATLPLKEGLHETDRDDKGTYSRAENNRYVSLQRRRVDGADYYLYFFSEQARHGTDAELEKFTAATGKAIIFVLFVIIGATSWFLTRFMTRRILPPLRELKHGAEHIQRGELDIQLVHKEKDEFRPVFSAFNLMAGELSQSLRERVKEEESRKELIASISHDIRTPLTAIKAYVEGLTDGVASTEEKKARYLAIIRKKTDELDNMIEQLFLLSKMDVGGRAVPLTEEDLAACVREAAEESREPMERRGMTLTMEAAGEAKVIGNPLLIRRILLNLWENSAKYKTDAEGHIRMRIENAAGAVRLIVEDDGPGVPEETLPHLFEVFYRTDKARSKTENGSGLGLAIVARAMQEMHGHVRADNASPHGLRVTLEWPDPSLVRIHSPRKEKQDEKDPDRRR